MLDRTETYASLCLPVCCIVLLRGQLVLCRQCTSCKSVNTLCQKLWLDLMKQANFSVDNFAQPVNDVINIQMAFREKKVPHPCSKGSRGNSAPREKHSTLGIGTL